MIRQRARSSDGSRHLSKREVAAEAAAILGFSALENGDKIGLLLFAAEPIVFVPPAKGTSHVLRLIRDLLHDEPELMSAVFVGLVAGSVVIAWRLIRRPAP